MPRLRLKPEMLHYPEDCARERLARFSPVGRGPTSATERSMQLDLDSGTDGPHTARLVTQPFQTVAEDVFI